MLQHTAPPTNRFQSRLETASVFASLMPPPGFDQASQATPSRAGRVSHHRSRSSIEPSVPFLIPRINTREPIIRAALLDV